MTLTIDLMGALLILVGSLLPVGSRLRARALAEASLFAGFAAIGTELLSDSLGTFVVGVGVVGFAVIFMSESLSRVTLRSEGPKSTMKNLFFRSSLLLTSALVFWIARLVRDDDTPSLLQPGSIEAIGAAAFCAFVLFSTRFLSAHRRWR
jgi:hypothetical protein